MKLTPKQKAFADEYLICGNATEAAKKAGYSEKTAGIIGFENLRKPNVSEYIAERQKQIDDYKFTLNFPANLAEETDIASKLEGIVSKETQLSVLSVVENVQTELERIEEEENAQKDDARDRVMQMTFGGVSGEQQDVLGYQGNKEPEQE